MLKKTKKNFNPAELLLNSQATYNEILRVCDNLVSKNLLKKNNTQFEKVLPSLEELEEVNFLGKKKFEEVEVEVEVKENFSTDEIEKLVKKVGGEIVKEIFPKTSFLIPKNLLTLTQTEKNILEMLKKTKKNFNPAELLLNSQATYNEILRVCDNLVSKNLLKKNNTQFEKVLPSLEELEEVNFLGKKKFEEVEVEVEVKENFSTEYYFFLTNF